MGIAQLRKSTDGSAPTLTGASYGEFDTLLQAVLVDGYGSQAGLGWSTIYTDTNKRIFQNDGSNMFLRVDHTSATGDARSILMSAYEVVSDVDNGQLQAPTQGTTLTIRIVSTTTGATPWTIIGDEAGFWFCWKPFYAQYGASGYGQMWYITYFGDYIPIDQSNTFNFFICGRTDTTWYSPIGPIDDQNNTEPGCWALRDSSLTPGAVPVGINPGTYYEDSGIGSTANVSPFTLIADSIDRLHFSMPTIHGSDGRILGWLPGLLNPLVARGDFEGNNLATFNGAEFTMSDRVYHLLRYRYYSSTTEIPSSICLVSGEGFRDVP